MRRLLFLSILLGLGCGASGPLVVNEFVASNIDGVTDPQGGTPDWVELGNTSSQDVFLDGWFISDDDANPQRHALDGLSVPADGYLVLFASGDTALGSDHLPFRLSKDGEMVVLSDGDTVVDSVTYGAQESDLALARIPDLTGDWASAAPTPGEPNE